VFKSVDASDVPSAAQITITCTGRCGFIRRIVRPPTTYLVCKPHHKHCKRNPAPVLVKQINLERLFARRRFHVHDRLTFTITRPNWTGKIWILTIRPNTAPRETIGCLLAGSSTPRDVC
jgi:hypothetical protein